MSKFGITTQKILLLLLGGLALGLAGSPRRQRWVFRAVVKEWKMLDRRELYRSIRRLYESKLISFVPQVDGSTEIILNRDGKKAALCYKLDEMEIKKPGKWDRKWRIALFDIPERQKYLRDTLRLRLRQLGLVKLQKSVFVHPYECRDEIDFIIEFYNARRYVRFIEADHIDNELYLRKRFYLI